MWLEATDKVLDDLSCRYVCASMILAHNHIHAKGPKDRYIHLIMGFCVQ
jgi:hypothetical protein